MADKTQQEAAALPPGDDLVTNAELASAEEDQFDSQHLVAEIATVIEQHDPSRPANIALYGPWGSGKSSIARLLANEFNDDHEQHVRRHTTDLRTRFVAFDAFKYAGHSLRRNFLLRIAEELAFPAGVGKDKSDSRGVKAKWKRGKANWKRGKAKRKRDKAKRKVEDRLYGTRTATMVRLDRELLCRLALVATFVLVPTLLAAFVGAAGWAAFGAEVNVGAGIRQFLPEMLTILAVPAAAALFALTRELVPTSVVTGSPSSEEQFGEEFHRLINDTDVDRVVVFVDEIDRCAPSEVVETLDTIRTFLDVPNCVVIVAADQRVLERALSEKVRQTTPADLTNPYYSGGSAYLDKVFHYQFSIPPLLPPVISRYALDLANSKHGAWDAVDREDVVGVLIPTHVRSPRRVKALLNNFVIAYRLAQNRNVSSAGDRTLADRAAELAVLVCLRSEFPLFAQDLPQHPSLPSLIRWLIENEPLQLDEVTADREDSGQESESQAREADRKPHGTTEAWRIAREYYTGQRAADQPFSPADVEERTPGGGASNDASVLVKAIRDDLISYLSKTGYIAPPGTDLIFMTDSSGFFGLSADVAEQLVRLAYDSDRRGLHTAWQSIDEHEVPSALRLLAHRTREHAIGEEAANMASSLLYAASLTQHDVLAAAVDEVVVAIQQQQRRNRLRDNDLPGALAVGLSSRRADAAAQLVAAVMASQRYTTDPGLAAQIVRYAEPLNQDHGNTVSLAATWLLVLDGKRFANTITALDDTVRRVLLWSWTGEHALVIDRAVERDDSDQEDSSEYTATQVGEAIDQLLANGLREAAEYVAMIAAWEGARPTVSVVQDRAQSFTPASTQDLAATAVSAATNGAWQAYSAWLPVATTDSYPLSSREKATPHFARVLWAERTHLLDEREAFKDALDAVRTFTPNAAELCESLAVELMSEGFGPVTQAAQAIDHFRTDFEHAEVFVESGVFPKEPIATAVASAVAATVRAQHTQLRSNRPGPDTTAHQDWAEDWATWAAPHADHEAVVGVVQAFKESPWVPSPRRDRIATQLAAAAGVDRPYTREEIAVISQAHAADSSTTSLVGSWLADFQQDEGDVYGIAASHLRSGVLPSSIAEAIAHWASSATRSERAEACAAALSELPAAGVATDYLIAIDTAAADHQLLATKIVEQVTSWQGRWNSELRANVLEAWSQLNVPAGSEAQTLLITRVALPLLDSQVAAYQMLEFPGLFVGFNPTLRERLREAFKRHGSGRAERLAVFVDKTGIEKRKSTVEKALRSLLGK